MCSVFPSTIPGWGEMKISLVRREAIMKVSLSSYPSRMFPSLLPQVLEHMTACLDLISRSGVPNMTPGEVSQSV